MAKVIAIGQPVNDSEREAIAGLRDHLPDTFTVIHNFELRQGHELYEIDVALLGPHCVHVIDVKGTRGLIDVHGGKWYPEGRAPYHSPLALLRKHAKALKSLICDRYPTHRALRGLYVDAAVLMTAPDALVQDPGGQDGPAVAYLGKCAAFFQARARIPDGRSTDVRAHLGQIRKAIVGQARPRNAPPCYGHWQVEEKLGGTDRYTEYRARHTLLGAKRGGTARLRIYPVDPYRPEAERQARAPPYRERVPGGGGAARTPERPHRAGVLPDGVRGPLRPGDRGRGRTRAAAARPEECAGADLRPEDRGRPRRARGPRPRPPERAPGGAPEPDPGRGDRRGLGPGAALRLRLRARRRGADEHHRRRRRRRTRPGVPGAGVLPGSFAGERGVGPLRRRARVLRAAGRGAGLDVDRRHDGQGRGLPGEALRAEARAARRIRRVVAGVVRLRRRRPSLHRRGRARPLQRRRRPGPPRGRQGRGAGARRAGGRAAGGGLRGPATGRRPRRTASASRRSSARAGSRWPTACSIRSRTPAASSSSSSGTAARPSSA